MQKSLKMKFILDIDKDEAFDYDKGESEKYNLSDYNKIIAQELKAFDWLTNLYYQTIDHPEHLKTDYNLNTY